MICIINCTILVHIISLFHFVPVIMLPAASPLTESPITTTNEIPPPITTATPTTVDITDVSITYSGPNTAGESYSLECTVTTTGSTDQPTITWQDPMSNNIITSGVVKTGSMSTLTFNPLAASHVGTYTCRATLGSAMDSAVWNVTVQGEYVRIIILIIGRYSFHSPLILLLSMVNFSNYDIHVFIHHNY